MIPSPATEDCLASGMKHIMSIRWSAEDAQTILQFYVTKNSHSTVKLENFPHFCLMTFPCVSEMCGGWYRAERGLENIGCYHHHAALQSVSGCSLQTVCSSSNAES